MLVLWPWFPLRIRAHQFSLEGLTHPASHQSALTACPSRVFLVPGAPDGLAAALRGLGPRSPTPSGQFLLSSPQNSVRFCHLQLRTHAMQLPSLPTTGAPESPVPGGPCLAHCGWPSTSEEPQALETLRSIGSFRKELPMGDRHGDVRGPGGQARQERCSGLGMLVQVHGLRSPP